MSSPKGYSYAASLKSNISDELVNIYLLRPVAGMLVKLLYATPVTPNHVTAVAILVGLAAGVFYAQGTQGYTIVGGLCVTLKDIFDSADGQLARAKGSGSRTGRFFDSIGDFVVNAVVFTAIGYTLSRSTGSPWYFLLAAGGFLGTTLRVSYHVFHQASYLHLRNAYTLNRVTEEIRDEDVREGGRALSLQKVFGILYGWQDRWMLKLDAWCRRGVSDTRVLAERWYGDSVGLRLSGFLGLGTELLILTVFSILGDLRVYLFLNLVALNVLWGGTVIYRRVSLRRRLLTPGT